MHENTLLYSPFDGWCWSRRWKNGAAALVPVLVSKFRAWRPTQQRARDGTAVRHKKGGLRRTA